MVKKANKLDALSKEWSLIDGQGLVRIIPTDTYRTGFVLVATVGPLAEKYDYYPDMTLGHHRVTITIDNANEKTAYALAADIDSALSSGESTAE